jgi:hypothetical protein
MSNLFGEGRAGSIGTKASPIDFSLPRPPTIIEAPIPVPVSAPPLQSPIQADIIGSGQTKKRLDFIGGSLAIPVGTGTVELEGTTGVAKPFFPSVGVKYRKQF